MRLVILIISCCIAYPAVAQQPADEAKVITITIGDLQKIVDQAVAHDRANMADAIAKEANEKLKRQIAPEPAPKDDKK